MGKNFSPDWYFASAFDITPDFLLSHGIKAVVLDIDNTLVTYGDAEPTEKVIGWISRQHSERKKPAFASHQT